MKDGRTSLYRFYASDGELLYIGISVKPMTRFHAHASDKEWRKIAEIRIEWHETRPQAMAAEKAAIIAEQPTWNSVHTPRHRVVSLASRNTGMTREESEALINSLIRWSRDKATAEAAGE